MAPEPTNDRNDTYKKREKMAKIARSNIIMLMSGKLKRKASSAIIKMGIQLMNKHDRRRHIPIQRSGQPNGDTLRGANEINSIENATKIQATTDGRADGPNQAAI